MQFPKSFSVKPSRFVILSVGPLLPFEDVLWGEKTGEQNIVKEIKHCQKKWLQHVQRMDTNRIPKQALQYRPKGRRNIGRPRKRWRDQLHFEDQGTGNTPNMMMMMMMLMMVMMMMTENYWSVEDILLGQYSVLYSSALIITIWNSLT